MTARHSPQRPAVDERLIMPDTRYEVVDGEVVYVSPSLEPHGSRHSKLSALLEAFAAPGYNAASDMLTRTSERSDFAPDGSIYPAARDPETGGRRMEELAFEVVSTESLRHAGRKAKALIERGVRRVFAIDVEHERGLEWSTATNGWEILGSDAHIEDVALALPLPVHDLVASATTDDAVAKALLAKKNQVLAGALDEAKAEGIAEGKAEAKAEAIAEGIAKGIAESVLVVLDSRGLTTTEVQRKRVMATRDHEILARWLRAAVTCASVDELLE